MSRYNWEDSLTNFEMTTVMNELQKECTTFSDIKSLIDKIPSSKISIPPTRLNQTSYIEVVLRFLHETIPTYYDEMDPDRLLPLYRSITYKSDDIHILSDIEEFNSDLFGGSSI